ncbi:MAG: hypothetical protein ACM3PY_21160 [Omnitrophica WOR_2 bacterium]
MMAKHNTRMQPGLLIEASDIAIEIFGKEAFSKRLGCAYTGIARNADFTLISIKLTTDC